VPAKPKRDAVPTGKREAILEAALELFAERGFHGTAVPLVAEKAGVGAGTLYRYFEGKEALVNTLYQEWKQRFGRALFDDFPFDGKPRKLFHELWRRMGSFAQEQPLAVAFLELHHHAPYLDAASRALDEIVMSPARSVIERAQKDRILREGDPHLLIAVAYGVFVGVLKSCAHGELTLSPELLDAAEECAWDAIRR
jgi:AcrR family transcriptional regulator